MNLSFLFGIFNTILVIGAPAERPIARQLVAETGFRFKFHANSHVRNIFPHDTYWMYRAKWEARNLKSHNKIYRGYIVLGRENVGVQWDGGCAINETVLCDVNNLAGCRAAIKETICGKR